MVLPDFIKINFDNLKIGKAIKAGEVKVENMLLSGSLNNPVVVVKQPMPPKKKRNQRGLRQ